MTGKIYFLYVVYYRADFIVIGSFFVYYYHLDAFIEAHSAAGVRALVADLYAGFDGKSL